MTTEERIKLFSELGERLKNEQTYASWIQPAMAKNGWFTRENILFSINSIANNLSESSLKSWLEKYQLPENKNKKIGVVMAGNIPLVGFHDLLSVLLCGYDLHVKMSTADPILPQKVLELLIEIEPAFAEKIHFAERIKTMDAVIATGSNNTSRYFEYYFSSIPHIIRKNRTSVAIITGDESPEQIKALGNDIFQYYGLGCRNVSKIYIPEEYDIHKFYEPLESFIWVADNKKYFNNYEYNRAIYLVNQDKFYDNNFLILKENTSLVSPVSVIFYEKYSDLKQVYSSLDEQKEKIQAIVGKGEGTIPFGTAQCPTFQDYADGVDTLEFLVNL